MVGLPACLCASTFDFIVAHDLSADGSIVVGASREPHGEAVRWIR